MLLLGLDFETTGLSFEKDLIIEIGAVIWDTERKAPVFIYSTLVDHGVPIPPEITGITGIDETMIQDFGVKPEEAFEKLWNCIKSCNAVVAHNGTNFDKPMLKAQTARDNSKWIEKPWVDTSVDVPYPEKCTTRKLVHLAAEHQFLNPFAHRAIFDVLTMFGVLNRYDINEVLKLAAEPNITLKAQVSYDDKELAKARGYRWQSDTKSWIKTLKQSQVLKEIEEAGFKIVEVGA